MWGIRVTPLYSRVHLLCRWRSMAENQNSRPYCQTYYKVVLNRSIALPNHLRLKKVMR
jgi:hypothetical protein